MTDIDAQMRLVAAWPITLRRDDVKAIIASLEAAKRMYKALKDNQYSRDMDWIEDAISSAEEAGFGIGNQPEEKM